MTVPSGEGGQGVGRGNGEWGTHRQVSERWTRGHWRKLIWSATRTSQPWHESELISCSPVDQKVILNLDKTFRGWPGCHPRPSVLFYLRLTFSSCRFSWWGPVGPPSPLAAQVSFLVWLMLSPSHQSLIHLIFLRELRQVHVGRGLLGQHLWNHRSLGSKVRTRGGKKREYRINDRSWNLG